MNKQLVIIYYKKIKIIKDKKKCSSVDDKYKKSNLIGERAKFLEKQMLNNKDLIEINEKDNLDDKRNKSVEYKIDGEEIINSKPVSNQKKKKSKVVFIDDF